MRIRKPLHIIPLRKDDDGSYWGRYKEHQIHLSRESKKVAWYIQVIAPCGSLAYDGWWRDSEGKPIREAISEAIRGACIDS